MGDKDLMLMGNDELSSNLISSTDPEEIKNIINMVNLNIKKKDVIRSGLMSDLQDKIVSQMSERVNKRPGEFSNKELLDYLNSIQAILNKSDRTDDIPTIAIQQNNTLNFSSLGGFDSTAKERIKEALRKVLESNDNNIVDIESNDEENFEYDRRIDETIE